MIQDIAPSKIDIAYTHRNTEDSSTDTVFSAQGRCFIFHERSVLAHTDDSCRPPLYAEIAGLVERIVYLFCIDEQEYYLADADLSSLLQGSASCASSAPKRTGENGETPKPPAAYDFIDILTFQKKADKPLAFAEMTAWHLFQWYRDNQFCGRCGEKLLHADNERMLHCLGCGNMVFPKIAPAVIVAVTDGSRLLLTRYRGRGYKNYALVAGFIEIGETPEQAAAREVMEETGVRIKNLQYYKSQPWGQAMDLLIGYFAELDGSDAIRMDPDELSEAGWHRREEIEYTDTGMSLTGEMISLFMHGNIS